MRVGKGRGWRFMMRSISQHAVVHDSSYNACFVVAGKASLVRKVLQSCSLDTKPLKSKGFLSGHKACAVHLGDRDNRVICPALVYRVTGTKGSGVSEAHVWVHPRVKDSAMECLKRNCPTSDVDVTSSDAYARVEIVGAKALEVVQKLAPSLDGEHELRGIRRLVLPDPRAAAWDLKLDLEHMDGPTDVAPSQAEFDASRQASRELALEQPWVENCAVGVKSYAATLINRGPVAMDGYTLIVPTSWIRPLWLGVNRTGARATGVAEWSWCALRFKRPVFPDDYLDTVAGADRRRELISDAEILAGLKSDPNVKSKPKGKISACLKALATREKTTDVRSVLRDKGEIASTTNEGDAVRVTLRCPWSGQPSFGSTVHVPTQAQYDAWIGKKDKTRPRRDDPSLAGQLGAPIGYVTSASPSPAAVGLASALVRVSAIRSLADTFKKGKTEVFVMLSPPGKPPVPAVATVVVDEKVFDDPWW